MLLRYVSLIVQAVKYIEPQIRLAAKAGKSKKEYKLSMLSDKTLEKVSNLAEAPIKAVFTDPSYGKVFLLSFLLFYYFY
jgi:polyribonucleotide nucleotidyltransferase